MSQAAAVAVAKCGGMGGGGIEKAGGGQTLSSAAAVVKSAAGDSNDMAHHHHLPGPRAAFYMPLQIFELGLQICFDHHLCVQCSSVLFFNAAINLSAAAAAAADAVFVVRANHTFCMDDAVDGYTI